LHSGEVTTTAQEKVSQRTIPAAPQKIGMAAEPKWCHFFIRAWSQGGSLSELAKALVQA
jgi:hypothetical protein